MTDVLESLAALASIDRSWWARAKCHGYVMDFPGRPTPWHVAAGDDPVDGIPAFRMVEYALLVCSSCPAQYDCARAAVLEEHRAGTRAMRIRKMRWLQKQKDWEQIIDLAELEEVPVQVTVDRVQESRTKKKAC